MKLSRVLIFTVCILFFSFGCSSKAIYNVENEPVPSHSTGAQPTFDEVQKAIMAACKNKGWSPRIVEKGLIDASIYVRSHKADVTISFTENAYSILYKDSANLGYSNGNIHRNYNNWVIKLSQAIQQYLDVNVQKY